MKKYATFHLLMINENKYIDGACISGYTYKKYGSNEIDNNCMIDSSISKKSIKKLKKYFDNVFLIPLIKYDSNFSLHTNKLKTRYEKWIDYSTTKWTVLLFDQYKKVLFCDIDTLAVNNYSNIFKIRTPAWTPYHKSAMDNKRISNIIKNVKTGNIYDTKFIENFTNKKITEICNYKIKNKNFFIPINASIVLLKPSKKTYTELFKFANNKKYLKMLSLLSGPDENLLFQFYICHKKKKVYQIGLEYLTTLWRYKRQNIAFSEIINPIILNFDSTEKPWLKKNKKEYYNEELLWYNLRKKLKL